MIGQYITIGIVLQIYDTTMFSNIARDYWEFTKPLTSKHPFVINMS